ncbi:MAG: 16S rRNA (cytidine(1402)-2'-O)-methyltransferase [Prochlorothrix sp.]
MSAVPDVPIEPATLYVVATPIGNLGDMTFRAVAVLRQVDLIAAEDTRCTGKLLQYFQIATPQVSYHHHNRSQRQPQLLQRLRDGQSIALVSDAGAPGISDPGVELVQACVEAGLGVVPVPGASAVTTGLMGAGLCLDAFIFEGFLPSQGAARRQTLERFQGEGRTVVFYESPHRLRATLGDLATVLGADRSLVLARELTKRHEEFWRGSIAEAIRCYEQRQPQGEYTLILGGATAAAPSLTPDSLKAELTALLAQGLSRSQASRQLAKVTPFTRQELYQLALTLSPEADGQELTDRS